ncbi:EAL domain-containing protein [Marinicaulis aureus]|uniref:EAL domain-containing protein n=1 Tax=Hyphococcus aureus TaxID=2666033 RepID=A0ABW1L469_9PROT
MGAQAVRLSNVDIDNALKNKDFEVLFQPVFDLGNGALARVESFVRWRHPKLGLLPPGAFISFFESQGRMSELTRYVLASSLKSYMEWRGPWPPGLSVNLALSDLSDEAFTSHFAKLLRDNDFPADLVTLECPMPPVDMSIEAAQVHFQRLAKTGARLAIEVRGRANELLRSLDPFPFDEIKTGGSAILRFARTVRGPGLSAIADLLDVANNANAAITAVGVEDQASLAALRGLGFTAAQGNHLAKVGSLKEFRPHRINEVRGLLDLEPLSQANLTALFRTEAPAAQASEAEPAKKKEGAPTEDALIERLNERVAQYDAPAQPDTPAKPASAAKAASRTDTAPSEEDAKKAKAREKAKALALAKRAKARAERKTAAIERAKAKAAARPADEVTDVSADAAAPAPRDMQDMLTRAFTPDEKPSAPETQSQPETASAPEQTAEPQSPAADATPNAGEPAEQGTPVFITREDIAPPKQEPAQKPAAQKQVKEDAAKPSIIERAMAQESRAQESSAQENAAQAAAAAAFANPVSLAVGASGAYFQPGIRVGAPALFGEPDTPIEPSGLNLPPQRPAPREAPAPRAPAPVAPPVQSAPAPQQEAPEEAPLFADPSSESMLGDLNRETAEAAAPVRRRKPFLKRTVVPISSHFWPKSWRRSWKRRAAARAEQRREQETVEPQAAE